MITVDWKDQELWEKYYRKKMELFKQYLHTDIVREKLLETSEYKDLIEYRKSLENEQSTSSGSSKGTKDES
jgi:hypothetical protein